MTQSTTPIAEQLRKICTYHGDEGTSGYCISNEQFAEIEKLIAESISGEEKYLIKQVIVTAHNQIDSPEGGWSNWTDKDQIIKIYKTDLLTKESK